MQINKGQQQQKPGQPNKFGQNPGKNQQGQQKPGQNAQGQQSWDKHQGK